MSLEVVYLIVMYIFVKLATRTCKYFLCHPFSGANMLVWGKVCLPKNPQVTIPLKKLMIIGIDLTTNMNHQPALFS